MALRAAAAQVQDHRWVVFTSVNAVNRFRPGCAIRPSGRCWSPRWATADTLRWAGVEPDLVPAEHSARGLVEEFPAAAAEADGGGGRVLFPSADLSARHQ